MVHTVEHPSTKYKYLYLNKKNNIRKVCFASLILDLLDAAAMLDLGKLRVKITGWHFGTCGAHDYMIIDRNDCCR